MRIPKADDVDPNLRKRLGERFRGISEIQRAYVTDVPEDALQRYRFMAVLQREPDHQRQGNEIVAEIDSAEIALSDEFGYTVKIEPITPEGARNFPDSSKVYEKLLAA